MTAELEALLPANTNMRKVMDGLRQASPEIKGQAVAYAASILAANVEPDETARLRTVQATASLLPESLDLVLLALRSFSVEIRFSMIVALDCLPSNVLAEHEATLLPAVWISAVTAQDSDVETMAADFLRLVSRKALRTEIESRDLSQVSDYFLRALCRSVFGRRRRPRALSHEIYRREGLLR